MAGPTAKEAAEAASSETAVNEAVTAARGTPVVPEHHRQKRVTWANDLERVRVFDVSEGAPSLHVQLYLLACLAMYGLLSIICCFCPLAQQITGRQPCVESSDMSV